MSRGRGDRMNWETGVDIYILSITNCPCHIPRQGLNHALLKLLTFTLNTPETSPGLEGGNWHDRSSVRYFQEAFSEPSSCTSPYLEKHQSPSCWWLFLVTSKASQDQQKPSGKTHAWWHVFLLHQNHIFTDIFLSASLEQFFRANLRCCFPGCSPHFAPHKT